MTTVIEAHGLTKSFGTTRALDDLDLAVEQGEVHGFLGPNGAGKSTTIRILLGLLRADAGSVRLLDGDPWRDVESLHRRIAYVPGDVNLWPNLTGGEVIDLLARLRGDADPARRTELLERFDLDPTKRCRSYSKGNRQKVALVAALSSRAAEVFLLDEPTSGLDPLMEAQFAEYARALRDEGRTILLSSHILSEVEALSDRISIIKGGRIVETGTLAQMRHLHSTRVRAQTRQPAALDALAGLSELRQDGTTVSFVVADPELDAAIAALSRSGLVSLVSEPPSLEELFLSRYERGEAGGRGEPVEPVAATDATAAATDAWRRDGGALR